MVRTIHAAILLLAAGTAAAQNVNSRLFDAIQNNDSATVSRLLAGGADRAVSGIHGVDHAFDLPVLSGPAASRS